ncbi:hypothetical protein [Nakamurella leprariae]|uniref:Uncharacterized protein n=1 Tax=Nakamurella leprariae TaxID=2803911 RepID=A0A938YG97_9ACTN|nr:hypothetical protein [Nakamurella leprariae]MBM9467270.1 hypothetical protein [Nakamurella leprariae]
MTTTSSPRWGFPMATAGSDPWPERQGWMDKVLKPLEELGAQIVIGTTAQRPQAGVGKRFYFDTSTQRLYLDTGSAWVEMSPVGSNTDPAALEYGAAVKRGSSRTAARGDHTHFIPSTVVSHELVIAGTPPPSVGRLRWAFFHRIVQAGGGGGGVLGDLNPFGEFSLPTPFTNGVVHARAESIDPDSAGGAIYVSRAGTEANWTTGSPGYVRFRAFQRGNPNQPEAVGPMRLQLAVCGW